MDTRQHGNGQQVLQSIVFKFIHLAEAERDGTSGTEIGRNFGAKRTSDPFFGQPGAKVRHACFAAGKFFALILPCNQAQRAQCLMYKHGSDATVDRRL